MRTQQQYPYQWVRRVVMLSVWGLLGLAPAAQADDVTTCGQVLRGPRVYHLRQDLECDGRGIVLESTTLLLHGHTIHCSPRTLGCVTLTGAHAQIWNGTIDEDFHESLVLEGEGEHVVANVVVQPIDATVIVRSNDNRLFNVTATSGYNPAFRVLGNDNTLTHITAVCPLVVFGGCVHVEGADNTLVDLDVTVAEDFGPAPQGGIRVLGNDNTVRLSRIQNMDGPALVVMGRDNTLQAG